MHIILSSDVFKLSRMRRMFQIYPQIFNDVKHCAAVVHETLQEAATEKFKDAAVLSSLADKHVACTYQSTLLVIARVTPNNVWKHNY